MEKMAGAFALLAGFAVLVVVAYVWLALFLNKFNKLVYGKSTPMAWIPIANGYLLGKLAYNKMVGWIFVICSLLLGNYSTTVNGVEKVYSILPKDISSFAGQIYALTIICTYVYAAKKYNKLKKNGNSAQFQQPTQNFASPQTIQPIQTSNNGFVNTSNSQPIMPSNQADQNSINNL